MRGTLGRVIPTAATYTVLYTATVNCSYVDLDIFVVNPNATTDATIQIGISADDTWAANEAIENGTIVAKNGGTHEVIARKISPGDRVIVYSTLDDTVFRVEGSEEILY